MSRLPSFIKYIAIQFVKLTMLLLILRLVFFLTMFQQVDSAMSEVTKAWYLGVKFDIRLSLLLLIIPSLLVTIFYKSFLTSKPIKLVLKIYMLLIYVAVALFYVFDFGHYDYLATRLNSTVMRFADDVAISLNMMWESYPVIWGVLALILFVLAINFILNIENKKISPQPKPMKRGAYTVSILVLVLLFAGGIYGKWSYFPLRWSEAMFSKNASVNSFALNPVLYFYDSFRFKDQTFDADKTRNYYDVVTTQINVGDTDKDKLLYTRNIKGTDVQKPNIVIVLLESGGASLMGCFGNPMNATPHIDSLVADSKLFSNFFVPAFGTARSVWASLTGIPDLATEKTASRNPFVIDQRLIFDQFEGYERHYIIGGNASWANIRALFKNNIRDLSIFEEGNYGDAFEGEKVDVWGLDDYSLITNADKIFDNATEKGKPFIAFLQTASNHRPYTIGNHSGDFKVVTEAETDMKMLSESGFLGIDQFNALRYLDYNIGHMIDLAKKSDYYENTIFMFFGDHNARTLEYNHMKYDEFALGINYLHVPLIVHAPGYLKPAVDSLPASLIDIMPTAASMAGIDYSNYTLGVDLNDTTLYNKRIAFIKPFKDIPYVGIIDNRYYMEKNLLDNKISVYDLRSDNISRNIYNEDTNRWKVYKDMLNGYYETSLYMMFNNKKQSE